MSTPLIQLEHVSKVYPGKVIALRDVSLSVEKGEFVSIVGRSGTGKTTLVKLLTAEERLTAGTITIGRWQVHSMKNSDVPYFRRDIGVVFQDFKLLPQKTVYENIAFALMVSDAPSSVIKDMVPKVISTVGLSGKERRFPRELSGGEQQRVAIARALVHEPDILIADELTGDLDVIYGFEVMETLLKINHMGKTIVIATHDKDIVNRLNKRVLTLVEGEIVSDQKQGKYLL